MSAEFVAAMEEVLEVYAEPDDPRRPQVNVDETHQPLSKEPRPPLPAQPGQPVRCDDAYERQGTRTLLRVIDPPAGWRHVHVPARRTALDVAYERPWLVDEGYPDADVIRVVWDNRNTPKIASRYKAFAPAEARRIARNLELHSTPKPGSWLHMAEIEWSVLQPQCLDRRISDADTLTREVAVWEHQRNAEHATIDWRFSVSEARKKLERLYPSLPS